MWRSVIVEPTFKFKLLAGRVIAIPAELDTNTDDPAPTGVDCALAVMLTGIDLLEMTVITIVTFCPLVTLYVG
jgi:hypothetical protein